MTKTSDNRINHSQVNDKEIINNQSEGKEINKNLYDITLKVVMGKNSYFDEGGALIIKNVVALAPLKAVSTKGEVVNLGEEVIRRTNWNELLLGRPVVIGHRYVNGCSLPLTLKGTVKKVNVRGQEVVVDLIIYDRPLQRKIISRELRAVSLSFTYNARKQTVDYINHLGLVKLGQVRQAVINLAKEGDNMEDKMQKKTKEQVKDESDEINTEDNFSREKLIGEFKRMKEGNSELQFKLAAYQKKEESWQETHRLALEVLESLGVPYLGLEIKADEETGADARERREKIKHYQEEKIKQVLGEVEGDRATLFRLAVKQEKEREQKVREAGEHYRNINLHSGSLRESYYCKGLGDIIQEKADKLSDHRLANYGLVSHELTNHGLTSHELAKK